MDTWGTSLSGRVAVVTGAGAEGDAIGIGRATALLLARGGASIVAVDRHEEDGVRTVEMIEAQGGRVELVTADVTAPDDVDRIAATAADRFGGADIVVNNVGIGSRGSVVETEPRIWERVMRVNVDSAYLVSRALIPQLAERGGGAIVNLSSISALRPRGLTAYSTSKGAIIALTKAMAVDHAGDGIRVNCVVPGPLFTPIAGSTRMSAEDRERRRQASPLSIEGNGWDAAQAIAFLVSDAARYITGQALVVDGGVTLSGPDR